LGATLPTVPGNASGLQWVPLFYTAAEGIYIWMWDFENSSITHASDNSIILLSLSKNMWIFDSGVTDHLSISIYYQSNFQYDNSIFSITVANASHVLDQRIGRICCSQFCLMSCAFHHFDQIYYHSVKLSKS
jgi:hypothetical protein